MEIETVCDYQALKLTLRLRYEDFEQLYYCPSYTIKLHESIAVWHTLCLLLGLGENCTACKSFLCLIFQYRAIDILM